jgi:hypothetical protein
VISNKSIVIDPISGKVMLGKNIDRGLWSSSLKDRMATNFDKSDRVREFLKQKRTAKEVIPR